MVFCWSRGPGTPWVSVLSCPSCLSASSPPAIKSICLPPAPHSPQISLTKSSFLSDISFLRLLTCCQLFEKLLRAPDKASFFIL